jgi:hypothetical protein
LEVTPIPFRQAVIFAQNTLANDDGLVIGLDCYGVLIGLSLAMAWFQIMVMVAIVAVAMDKLSMVVGMGNGPRRATAAVLAHNL